MDRRYTVDVIIPTFRPGREFAELIRGLKSQEYPIRKIIIINTESGIFPDELFGKSDFSTENYQGAREPDGVRIQIAHIHPEEFDHGGTRMMGAGMSEADIVVYMTQDAIPADGKLIGSFVSVFEKHEDIGIAYGRQLPREDCDILERYTRAFNYPEESRIKSGEDLEELGIKTFFCSDVCAAYRREYLLGTGGFTSPAIFNEDMIFAGQRILAGDRIAYAAQARVIHSHSYTGRQQFRRNFDLAVSQAQHPEVFGGISSEDEGIRLVKEEAGYLLRRKCFFQVFRLVVQSGCKYFGFFMGKRYENLPEWLIMKCTSNKNYWKNVGKGQI
ncbi:MAG: glycosyltransferase [Clostridiales bacterium]|nr:glycosyltransferase [Clostridiales bacterium]